MEYKIVSDIDCQRLAEKVNLSIKEGWKPQGGVAMIHTSIAAGVNCGNIRMAQAMVKESISEREHRF